MLNRRALAISLVLMLHHKTSEAPFAIVNFFQLPLFILLVSFFTYLAIHLFLEAPVTRTCFSTIPQQCTPHSQHQKLKFTVKSFFFAFSPFVCSTRDKNKFNFIAFSRFITRKLLKLATYNLSFYSTLFQKTVKWNFATSKIQL